MQIRPTSNVQSASSVSLQTQNTTRETGAADSLPSDQLDISLEAQMMSTSATTNDIRADRVADLRAQIASGTYDSAEKMDTAISRMINELA